MRTGSSVFPTRARTRDFRAVPHFERATPRTARPIEPLRPAAGRTPSSANSPLTGSLAGSDQTDTSPASAGLAVLRPDFARQKAATHRYFARRRWGGAGKGSEGHSATARGPERSAASGARRPEGRLRRPEG